MYYSYKRFFYIIFALILYIVGFLSSYPYLLEFKTEGSSKIDTVRSILEYSIMFLSFLVFCLLILRKNRWFKALAYILFLILTLNFSLSASCFFIYKQGFNVGMMLSIIETNIDEAKSMMNTMLLPILSTLLFFSILIMIFRGGDEIKPKGKSKILLIIFSSCWLILPFIFYIKHVYVANKGGGFMIKNIFYHTLDVERALNLKNEIKEIQNVKINYNFVNNNEEPVNNIILLIGESARRRNMSLYGYQKRETTPIANSERSNMLLFENAYAPAGITNLAVPIILSNVNIDHYSREINKLGDNIVSAANHLGYSTYWLSTQGGAQGITAIASFAQHKKYLNGFDEVLISELRESLKTENKKLIVLHINGSHPYVCDKYPKSEAVWNGGIHECYDNSIKYTDKIIGKIINEIKNKNSVLIYLSDHGQKLDDDKYIHGDYREASEVPYFIWYSKKINSEKKGKSISELTSTTTLYANVLGFMGVKNPNIVNNSGKYLNLKLNTIKYENLK